MTISRAGRFAFAVSAAALAVLASTGPAAAGCPPTPKSQEQCLPIGQTSLEIDAYGNFEWKASRGSSASAEEFVDDSASYQLCAWDEEHLVVAADIPAGSECRGASCWSRKKDSWRYSDDVGANGDIRILDFTGSNDNSTKLRAVTMVIGGIILPVTGGVVVQITRTDNDTCFESFIPADSFRRDDKAEFAGRFVDPSAPGSDD